MQNVPPPHLPEPPKRLPTMAIPWIIMVVFVALLVAEFAIINTWERGDCNIGGALLCLLGVAISAVLVPITTFIQQMRSPEGHRRVGQAVTLYVLSALILFPTVLVALIPIIFADIC